MTNIRFRVLPSILPVDGREIELQAAGDYLQYRYEGDTDWTNLIALSELAGPAGPSSEFRSDGTNLQYRTVGDVDWIDIMPLADITGPTGPTGATGATGPAGPGDVDGPSSATANRIVGFDGTTGKLIKELTPLQARDAAEAYGDYGIAGLKPDKLSTDVLRLYAGVTYGPDGQLVSRNTNLYYDIDMNTVGVGGLDRVGGGINETDYCVYTLRRNTDGLFGAVLSPARFYGDVAVPSGYTLVRKLRFGFRYRPAWDGIPNHDAMNWPWPTMHLTNAEATATFRVLSGGTATSWATIQCNGMMPDNARVAKIMVRAQCGAAAGTGYIRSPGSGQLTGIEFSCSANQVYTTATEIRVNSTLDLEYQVTGDVALTVWILGYAQTEPS